MKATLEVMLIVMILLVWATVSWSATAYKFSAFNVNFPGAHSTAVTAIDAKGWTAGSFQDQQGDSWAYSRRHGTRQARLYVSGQGHEAHGMNDSSHIVGKVHRRELSECAADSVVMGFKQTSEGVITYTCLDGARYDPMDVNNSGVEVGAYRPSWDEGRWHCVVWSPPTAEFWHFTLPGAEGCRVHDITNGGVLSGSWQTPKGPSRGWVARSVPDAVAGVFIPIDIPNTRHSWVEGVCDDGSLVGTFVDQSFLDHGYHRAPDGVITPLDFPGARGTRILGANNKCWVVRHWHVENADGTLR
jgi:hypothetical protein